MTVQKDLNNYFLKVQRGKFLQVLLIKEIREIWQRVFPQDKPLEPEKRKLFADDVFFIFLGPKKEILSVGRLRPVKKVLFLGTLYNIQGIADIVSVIERQGYGKIIMQAMHKYLIHRKQTGIGFCSRGISIFYQKCGFKIAKNMTNRFLYKDSRGKIIRDVGYDDVLYVNGKNGFMEKILEHPVEKIFIPCRHW